MISLSSRPSPFLRNLQKLLQVDWRSLLGITIASPEVGDSFKGLYISTFDGNPVIASVVHTTIEAIEKRSLLENAERFRFWIRLLKRF